MGESIKWEGNMSGEKCSDPADRQLEMAVVYTGMWCA